MVVRRTTLSPHGPMRLRKKGVAGQVLVGLGAGPSPLGKAQVGVLDELQLGGQARGAGRPPSLTLAP